MAKALIINDPYGQIVRRYYMHFPEEPSLPGVTLRVDQPQIVQNMCLDTLLQAILDSWANKSFPGPDLLIVSHGNQNGLTMRLYPNHVTDARSEVLKILMDSTGNQNKAVLLNLSVNQVLGLINKIAQVRKLRIGTVHFRGCSIGANLDNLRALRNLLGAQSVTGLYVLSTYANVPTVGVISTAAFDEYIANHPNAHISSFHQGRLVFHTQPAGGTNDIVHVNIESPAVLPLWLSMFMSNFVPSAGQMQNNLPVHYLRVSPPILPLEPQYPQHIRNVH